MPLIKPLVLSKAKTVHILLGFPEKNDDVKRKIHKPQKARLQAVVFFFKEWSVIWENEQKQKNGVILK